MVSYKINNVNSAFVNNFHHDYNTNLEKSRNVILSSGKYTAQGMRVRIASSEALSHNLLTFSFCPPRHAPMGNYVNHINLHQDRTEFGREAEKN